MLFLMVFTILTAKPEIPLIGLSRNLLTPTNAFAIGCESSISPPALLNFSLLPVNAALASSPVELITVETCSFVLVKRSPIFLPAEVITEFTEPGIEVKNLPRLSALSENFLPMTLVPVLIEAHVLDAHSLAAVVALVQVPDAHSFRLFQLSLNLSSMTPTPLRKLVYCLDVHVVNSLSFLAHHSLTPVVQLLKLSTLSLNFALTTLAFSTAPALKFLTPLEILLGRSFTAVTAFLIAPSLTTSPFWKRSVSDSKTVRSIPVSLSCLPVLTS